MCIKILHILQAGTFGDCKTLTQQFYNNCHVRYPLATAFIPPSIANGEQDSLSVANSCNASQPESCKEIHSH